MALRLLAASFLLAVLGACGGAAVSQPALVFPSHDELAHLPARKPLADAFGDGTVSVDAWTFESVPIPDGATYDDPSPWGRILRELVSAHAATTALSPPLRCAAQEMARFHLAKQALPAESLRRFMAARCGVVAANVMPSVVSAPVPAATPDEQIAAQFRADLAKLFDQKLASGHRLVGLAVARDAGHISVATLVAEDEARIESSSRGVDAKRRIVLRGGVRGEFAEITALVNRGDFGVAACVSDGAVRLPQFAVQCELDPADKFAWVELIGRKREGLLLHTLAETLIYEGDGAAVSYKARHLGPPSPARTAQEAAGALTEGLNRVRRDAKLAPLTIAAKESRESARLAGTLINAMISADDGVAERAALGLLAGWDVEGMIRNGTFFAGVVSPERDASAWLDFALERPVGRQALLDPDARQIAVGPIAPEGTAGLGAVVTTYAFFGSGDHAKDEAVFFERLQEARDAMGLPAPVRITGFPPMSVECARVEREGRSPMAALEDMMASAVDRTGRPVAGYVLETNDLTRVDVPKQLLARGPLEVIVGITHHRPPSAAWGQYVVFVIVLGATGQVSQVTMTARAGEPIAHPSVSVR
jgi:hypothetical protein